jgi:hypothetical protein
MPELSTPPSRAAELDPQDLMRAALHETGARGFDDLQFLPSMERWLRGALTEGRLNAVGLMGAQANIHRILVNRLRIESDLRRHPEILVEDVSAPIIVTGVPRTGTTKLQRVLSNDPQSAPVPLWRLLNPAPLPGATGDGRDPRIEVAREFVAGLRQIAPDWNMGHPTDPEYPDEETFAMEMTFDSVVNCCRAQSRSFRDWWLSRSKEYAYEFLRLILQYWQWQDGGSAERPFVLKSPDHVGHLDLIAETFPNAAVVHCHRDPVTTVPSTARLIESMLRISTDDLDLAELGDWSMSYFAQSLNRNLEQRAELAGRLTIVDVAFDDIVHRPGAVAREVHRARGRELTAEEEHAMAAWDEQIPHTRTHTYSLERYHLTAEAVTAAFAPYIERFAEAYESGGSA